MFQNIFVSLTFEILFGSLRYGEALILIKLCFVLGLTIVCRLILFCLSTEYDARVKSSMLLVLSRVAQQVRRGVTAPRRRQRRMARTIISVSQAKLLLLNCFIGSSHTLRIALLRKIRTVFLTW